MRLLLVAAYFSRSNQFALLTHVRTYIYTIPAMLRLPFTCLYNPTIFEDIQSVSYSFLFIQYQSIAWTRFAVKTQTVLAYSSSFKLSEKFYAVISNGISQQIEQCETSLAAVSLQTRRKNRKFFFIHWLCKACVAWRFFACSINAHPLSRLPPS